MNVIITQNALGAMNTEPYIEFIEAVVVGVVIFSSIIGLKLLQYRYVLRKHEGRTTRQLFSTETLWDKIDLWASKRGYEMVKQDNSSRLYQRYKSLIGTLSVEITERSGYYIFEAWIIPTKSKVCFFDWTWGLAIDEVNIDRSSLLLTAKDKLRYDFNKLLRSVGAPRLD